MTLKEDATEIKEQFLNRIANEYGFFQTTRDIFIARFTEKNAFTRNKQIANNLKIKEYELSKYLGTICSQLGFASSRRGRKPKGKSPWEKAYQWIWNEKYHDFIKQESSIDNKEAEVKIVIDWCLVCSQMLIKQQETQRLRSKATERGFEVNIDDVHLGLVERKQQQRRTGNIDAKQLNQLEPQVITKTYRHDEFLKRFTEQNQGSKNRHTAIIGEAGAGKTTLLNKVASHIEENTENLFVFISLSNLEGQNLREYLLKHWLCEAIGVSYPELDVTPEIENKFIKRFLQGSVWLLLDGVDEMTSSIKTRNITALHWIKSQLTDWLNQVRVVLTCRNNVWDASVNNGMTGFDTFKALDFEQEQVNKFIQNWFNGADDQQRGTLLKTKLQEPGRERIRDLVRNPLRLSLLCQTFDINNADLPETKAALYRQFILYLQEWKQHIHPIDKEIQNELHQALGKLALAGINSETKFRFRDSIARQEIGDSLFELACKVNWLNQVDRDPQTDEAVFAFFHPNFQEYFAALVINDWHHFIHHFPCNPQEGNYLIFESHWKEIYLLWLGIDNVDNTNKNKLINALLEFDDVCGYNKFYSHQAFSLGIEGMLEFKDYKMTQDILEEAIDLWQEKKLLESAEKAIIEIDKTQATYILVNKLKDYAIQILQNEKDCCILSEIPEIIGKVCPGNLEATNILIDLLNKSINNFTDTTTDFSLQIIFIISDLGNVAYCRDEAFITLRNLILTDTNLFIQRSAILAMSKIALDNTKYMINQLPYAGKTERDCLYWCYLLGSIDDDSWKVISIFVRLLKSENEDIVLEAIESLGIIGLKMPEAIRYCNVIENLVYLSDKFNYEPGNDLLYERIAWCLGEIGVINQDAINALKNILKLYKSESVCCQVVEILYKLGVDTSIYIDNINKILQNDNTYEEYRLHAAYILILTNQNKLNAINFVIQSLCITQEDLSFNYEKCFKSITNADLLQKIVRKLRQSGMNDKCELGQQNHNIGEIVRHCSQNLSYQEFYLAWHDESITIQSLKKQFSNLATKIKTTEKTYPIMINAQALQNETDKSEISQEICNQIYLTTLPNIQIPEVCNASQLKRIIPEIISKIKRHKLAIIFNNCNPNTELIDFCKKIADVVYIAWITNEPLESPLQGFLPNQPNLLNAIQSWINEIE